MTPLDRTIASIDAVLAEPPAVCMRRECGAPTVPAISPWCTPDCARLQWQAIRASERPAHTEFVPAVERVPQADTAATELVAAPAVRPSLVHRALHRITRRTR